MIGSVLLAWEYPSCARWDTDERYRSTVDFIRFELVPQEGKTLWFPNILHGNSVTDVQVIDQMITQNNRLSLYPPGIGYVTAYGQFDTICANFGDHLVRFPFDTQTCSLDFVSFSPVTSVDLANLGKY